MILVYLNSHSQIQKWNPQLNSYIQFNKQIFQHQRTQMGGQTSKLKGLKIDRERWSKMEEKGDYDIMWDKQGDQAQLYRFILDQTMDIENEIDVNNYRSRNQGNHVRVIGAQETAQKVGLCGKQKNVDVLTERIPATLYDSRQLSFQQSNIVLYNALKGYSRLNDKFGPIQVTDRMIGFNSEGNTRVWINENFGKNHPINFKDHDSNNLTDIKSNNEQRMVRNILSIVERKCERGEFPQPYRTDIYRTSSFSQVLQFVQSANVVPFSVLEENRVYLEKQVQQQAVISSSGYRSSVAPAPVTTYIKPVNNTRVSFNYISPGGSRF